MREKHVLITGGAGFIGSHLVDDLVAQGHRVRVLDSLTSQVHGERRNRPCYLNPSAELIIGDVRDGRVIRSCLSGIDAVVHLAAAVGVGQSMYQIRHYTGVNNLGTAALMEALIEHPMERLVIASSMSVYGEGLCHDAGGLPREPRERSNHQLLAGNWELVDEVGRKLVPCPTPESKRPDLASIYALSKFDQERMCLILGKAYGIPVVALRFFNVFGTRQALSNPYTGVLAIFASRFLNGRPPLIYEDGHQMRDFVSVHDVVQSCRLALESESAVGEVFNVGSGRPRRVIEVAQALARILDCQAITPEITGKFRKGDIRHCFADISKARTLLHYEPSVSLEDGLVELAGWLESQVACDKVGIAAAELAARGLTPAPARTTAPPPAPEPHSGPGLFEWFHPGDRERVTSVIAEARSLGISKIRTVISWAHYAEDPSWCQWLMPQLAGHVELLPCFTDTPLALGIQPNRSAPPRDASAFASFLNEILERLGHTFAWAELWNEPNNLNGWDRRLDPEWSCFAEMICLAADRCHAAGKKAVLGGMCPLDEAWLDQMGRLGVLRQVDAVGVHGFPGTWEREWDCWDEPISKVREVISRYHPSAEVWITAAGYSTWQHDEFEQLRELARLTEAPADRTYWYAARDLYPFLPYQDVRHAHFGLQCEDGTPKLLYRIWKNEGLEGVRRLATLKSCPTAHAKVRSLNGVGGDGAVSCVGMRTAALVSRRSERRSYVLITGGAGFIGTNLAHHLLSAGSAVRIFDNLSRPGVEQNLDWLQSTHRSGLQIQIGDVRNLHALREAVAGATQVFHFAAQVAVTTSILHPLADFEINLGGTLNVLEALRSDDDPPPLLFTSTNKVYGDLSDLELDEQPTRYVALDASIQGNGIDEQRPLQFHCPYGCSKGGSDQYVLDYARTGNLPAVVFRMSCIYGPHQCGNEDQGWVAHFLIRAMEDQPITLFGNGKQVRDILHVDDLIAAMRRAMANIERTRGLAFNVGGGPRNSVSLLELLDIVAKLQKHDPEVTFEDWRTGDQRYYVSDARKLERLCGWRPRISARKGVEKLRNWLRQEGVKPAAQLLISAGA